MCKLQKCDENVHLHRGKIGGLLLYTSAETRCACWLCGPSASNGSRQCTIMFDAASSLIFTGQSLYCNDCWEHHNEQRRIARIRISLKRRREKEETALKQSQPRSQSLRERSRRPVLLWSSDHQQEHCQKGALP